MILVYLVLSYDDFFCDKQLYIYYSVSLHIQIHNWNILQRPLSTIPYSLYKFVLNCTGPYIVVTRGTFRMI